MVEKPNPFLSSRWTVASSKSLKENKNGQDIRIHKGFCYRMMSWKDAVSKKNVCLRATG